jgi:hypothetical protein
MIYTPSSISEMLLDAMGAMFVPDDLIDYRRIIKHAVFAVVVQRLPFELKLRGTSHLKYSKWYKFLVVFRSTASQIMSLYRLAMKKKLSPCSIDSEKRKQPSLGLGHDQIVDHAWQAHVRVCVIANVGGVRY